MSPEPKVDPMSRLPEGLFHLWRDESSVATIEFLFALPVLPVIFTASFESGLMMTRSIMLGSEPIKPLVFGLAH